MTEATSNPQPLMSGWWRGAIILDGALLILLGLGAIFMPLVATMAATLLFGGLLLAAGVISLITSIFDWRATGFFWRLLWGAIATLAGLCILFHLWLGALSLTLLLGASLILQGAISVGHAVAHRHREGYPWGWMATGGVATALLGLLLVWGLPHAGLIVPGLFLAVNLLSYGFSLLALGLARAPKQT